MSKFTISYKGQNVQELETLRIMIPAHDMLSEILMAQKRFSKVSNESIESGYIKPFIDLMNMCNTINMGGKSGWCESFQEPIKRWASEMFKNNWGNPFKDFTSIEAIKNVKKNDYVKKLNNNRKNNGAINLLMNMDFEMNPDGLFKRDGISVLKTLVELNTSPSLAAVRDVFNYEMINILYNLIKNLTSETPCGGYKIEEVVEMVFPNRVIDKLIIKKSDSISLNLSCLEDMRNMESNIFGDIGVFAPRYGLLFINSLKELFQKNIPNEFKNYLSCEMLLQINENLVLIDESHQSTNKDTLSLKGVGLRVSDDMPFREKFMTGVENMFVSMTKYARDEKSIMDEWDTIVTDILMRLDASENEIPKVRKAVKF